MNSVPGYITFSHERDTWMYRNPYVPYWAEIPAYVARNLADQGYVILDAI